MNNQHTHSRLLNSSSEALLSELLDGVPEGQPFDAADLLERHAQLKSRPSLVVDLAYEDYWRKLQSGCDVDVDHFAGQFPEVRDRLLHMIEVGDLIQQSPDVFLSLMDPEWPEAPGTLGCFEILSQIGSGAFSKVYFAQDLSLARRPVTLKITRHAVREADALGQLQHPNIVSPLGLYDELIPGLVVIAMPFNGRATLSDLIQCRQQAQGLSDRFDYQDFLRTENAEFGQAAEAEFVAPRLSFVQTTAWIGAQVAEGLASAHAKGFCHCDIKPSNILLRSSGAPLILDFNLSVSEERHAYTGGTRAYIAPEQLEGLGEAASLGGAVDVYSLGATLIELIQGRPPFELLTDHSFEGDERRHPLTDGADRFSFDAETREQIGERFAKLLEDCVALDPRQRPTSAALAREMHALVQPEGTSSLTTSHRRVLAGGLASLLALMVIVVWSIVSAPTLDQRVQLGMSALVDGNSADSAARQFSRVVAADPARLDARVLHACALIQLKDWQVAFVELRELAKTSSSPELHALMGYVLCRWDRQHQIAEYEYDIAYRAGLNRLDVLNNLAYCQLRLAKGREGEQTLAKAKELGLNSSTLLFTEAQAELKLCRERNLKPRLEVAEAMLRDPELSKYRDAWRFSLPLYLLATRTDHSYVDRTYEVLRDGIAHGLTGADLKSMPTSDVVAADPRVVELMRTVSVDSAAHQSPSDIDRLVSPPVSSPDYLRELIAAVSLSENSTGIAQAANSH